MESLKQELLHLMAHKGELHSQLDAVRRALRDVDVLLKHVEARLQAASQAEQKPDSRTDSDG